MNAFAYTYCNVQAFCTRYIEVEVLVLLLVLCDCELGNNQYIEHSNNYTYKYIQYEYITCALVRKWFVNRDEHMLISILRITEEVSAANHKTLRTSDAM